MSSPPQSPLNIPLKRVVTAVLIMFGLLLVNVNYLQAVKADDYKQDSRNPRVLIERYNHERGAIIVGKEYVAQSFVTKDSRLKYLRKYPKGSVYAPVTGFQSIFSTSGIENSYDSMLDGSDARLAVTRFVDLVSGKPQKGANVELTIDPRAQKAAHDALSGAGKKGAVVALDPKTGAILAMVTLPSYDPNLFASHDPAKVVKEYDKLKKANNPDEPLLNRNIEKTYPPGSTFKVMTAAAAMQNESLTPDSQVKAPTSYTPPQTTTPIFNSGRAVCGGGDEVSLQHALEKSCNTPFSILAVDIGREKLFEQAKAFGIGEPVGIPMTVAPSSLGDLDMDKPALAQSAIGQRNVQVTPLQMAMIAAGIGNGGKVMSPYLVKKVIGPDNSEIEATEPKQLSEAMSPRVAKDLTTMMVGVVENGTGTAAQIDGVEVAGKTGTAQTEQGRPPHAWFISFAPAADPQIAVAVLVEYGGVAGSEASGGRAAAPIAKEVIEAVRTR